MSARDYVVSDDYAISNNRCLNKYNRKLAPNLVVWPAGH